MTLIKPFGDHLGDGIVQVSFTLPVSCSPSGNIAAKSIAEQMGLHHVEIVHSLELTSGISYYIIYGKVDYAINLDDIKVNIVDNEIKTKEEIESIIKHKLGTITVVGASTGSDTHSIGLDAILNSKGYHGHAGLEAYRGFIVHNLGSQVPNEKLIAMAVKEKADAILVSQTVNQQNLDIANLTALIDMLEAEGLRDRFILICGGAHISSEIAKELGYDAGFSKNTYAEHVATFLVLELLLRRKSNAI